MTIVREEQRTKIRKQCAKNRKHGMRTVTKWRGDGEKDRKMGMLDSVDVTFVKVVNVYDGQEGKRRER